jgi:Zn-dependent M28 family amino/carboxypeptidase
VFVGANDGASGVAVLMELAHWMPKLESRYGVDFVLFDAEEFVFRGTFGERGEYFVGSEYFATQYVRDRGRDYRYRWAVLLDMVGDADLQLYHELHSIRWRDTRPLVKDLWGTARALGVREFVSRIRHEVRDDHLKLHDVAGIPACDIIDFDYPHWHTEADTPDKCSGESLAKVAWVVHAWLQRVR